MSLTTSRVYRFGEFELNPGARALIREGRSLPVGSKAFDLLACLVTRAGKVVTKAELLEAVWPDSFVEEGNLSQHIFTLRKALGDRADYILTVPGRGYQFTAKVEEYPPVESPSEIVRHQMRERTEVVIEETFSAAAPAALPAPVLGGVRSYLLAGGVSAGVTLIVIGVVAGAAMAAGWRVPWRMAHRDYQRTVLADFANTTGDAAFDRSLKRALEIDLEQSPYIDVMSEREGVGLLGMMGKAGDTAITPEVARELCQRSNRQVVLSGGISRIGAEYLMTLEATDCATGKNLTGAKAEANAKEEILAGLDKVAEKVRSGLGESAQSLESYEVPILQATTPSFEALKSYSIGNDLAAQGKPETETLPFYQRAVELDPQFAMAYAALATSYYNLNEFALATQFYRKAFDLSGRVGSKEQLTIRAHYYSEGQGDLDQGIKAYQLWANTYPHDWIPSVNLANIYIQMGHYDQAIAAAEHALALGPDRAINYSVLARAYKRANRFADAKRVGQQAIERKKDSAGLHASLYEIAFAEQDRAALDRESAWNKTHNDDWYLKYTEGESAAFGGRLGEMERSLHEAEEIALRGSLPETAFDVAIDRAFFELEFGLPGMAKATLGRVEQLAGQVGESAQDSSDLALLRAELGDATAVRRFLAMHQNGAEAGSLMTHVTLPRLRAALAIEGGRAAEAAAALSPAIDYEMADFTVPSQRGAAWLEDRKPELAAGEFRKILGHRGVDAISPLYPLAELGLARAYASAGDRDDARTHYQSFLTGWKDADPSLPVLVAAKTELARLR